MEGLLDKLLQNADYVTSDWDKEFYVSISKASELSGLSESQIRYFESLCTQSGITLGRREGPNARNRVYTKRDVRLLRWVYECNDVRLAEIAQFIKKEQKKILESLGEVTLPKLIKHEQHIAGHDMLISGLVTVLLTIWQEVATPPQAIIKGVIFGPQEEAWTVPFQRSIQEQGSVDLAHSLVTWFVDEEKEHPGGLKIFFSHQSWYLPFSEEIVYDTQRFSDTSTPLAVTLLWKPMDREVMLNKTPAICLDESKKMLTYMLMQSLKRVLQDISLPSDTAIFVYSRAHMGTEAVLHGLSLLFDHCVKPYFSDCYAYIARIRKDSSLEVLKYCGDVNAGYTPQLLDKAGVLDIHKTPWWIEFVKQQVNIALDRNASRRPESREERGSVVCLPLVRQGELIGVLGIENLHTDKDTHCLATREGMDGPALLRYLICLAEIAADYLDKQKAAGERAQRSHLAYTKDETTLWHWNIYQEGGINYTTTVKNILDWMQEIDVPMTNDVYVVIIDVARENELAKQYEGFDIIVDLVETTKRRIQSSIKADPVATDLDAKRQLVLFDIPVADHLVLVVTGPKMPYLLVFLERIRRIWGTPNDKFTWEGKEIPVSLQVGICTFPNLGSLARDEASEMMKHHLWELYHRLINNPSEKVFEYHAAVETAR